MKRVTCIFTSRFHSLIGAIKSQKKKAPLLLLLVILICNIAVLPRSAQAAPDEERWAVIVEATHYPGSPEAAQVMGQALINGGWQADHIMTLVDADATEAAIHSAIRDWLDPREDSDDIVLVAIAAHGNVGFFLDYYGAIVYYSTLHGWLDLLESSKIAVILEACYGGSAVDEFQYRSGYVVLAGCDNDQGSGGLLWGFIIAGMTLPLPVDLDTDWWVSTEELWAYADPLARAVDPTLRPQIWDGVTEMTRAPGFTTEVELFARRGHCFIATAAYGTSTAEEIDVLRAFRDEVLLESTLGSQLVEWYYQASPPVADFISEHEPLRTLVRELLVEPVAWLLEATGTLWRD